ncbi:hypothetical protein CTI12_AA557920 [Artemisia annua]|uniref:Uncharacterized protein n=1 Tax=Artemisia annua TaxID=35608 RepID=A0A2U1KVE7_ARTAN|nr:hypothetical protein CTI12_AA557920 [Artemisia annua]
MEHLDCWSLPVITLTSIALSLPNILNNTIASLLSCVSQSISYFTLVEENLNVSDDYASIQNATKMLWLEVENTGKNMVNEVDSMDIRSINDNAIYRSISANSMYRIIESILFSYHTEINEVIMEELFLE